MVGLDRQAAAHCTGYSLIDIHRAMGADRQFAKEILRTEATAELRHMQNIHEITQDPKNWRASVWWLERRSPERYAARSAGDVTSRQLKLFTSLFVELLCDEVQSIEDRRRVITRLQSFSSALDELLDDPASKLRNFDEIDDLLSESPDAQSDDDRENE